MQLKQTGQLNAELKFFEVAYEFIKDFSTKKLPKKLQKYIEQFEKMLSVAIAGYEANLQSIENANIDEMMLAYNNYSFSSSHRVLVIAHSQGNLFANKMYNQEIEPWQQNYMEIIAIATPANDIASDDQNSYYVTNYSDPFITMIPNALTPYNVNQTGDNNHDFIDSYLLGDKSALKIKNKFNWIMDKIKTKPSQWKITSKSDEGTKEYRGVFTHKFDTSWDQIYGFIFKDNNDSAYVYHVPDPNDPQNNFVYVKASFGGEEILDADAGDSWENQKPNQFYFLKGTDPAEYIEVQIVYLYIGRSSPNINSIKLYMSNGEKSILVYPNPEEGDPFIGTVVCSTCDGSTSTLTSPYTTIGKGFTVSDGPLGYPPPGYYDRYLDSKWAGTKYEGIFRDTVLAVIPFTSESGFWCNNSSAGNCNLENNFITNYNLSYNDYIDKIYRENFLGQLPSQ